MTLEHIGFWHRADSASNPQLWAGIWNSATPGWVQGYVRGGDAPDSNAESSLFFSAGQNTEGKIGAFNVSNLDGHSLSAFRDAFVDTAIITIGDNKAPIIGLPSGPSKWVNQIPAEPITVTASDAGLGISQLTPIAEGASPPQWPPLKNVGCTGTTVLPCPGTTNFSLTHHGEGPGEVRDYDPSTMPQGIDKVILYAEDPLGNKSSGAKAEVRVDHTAPSLAISGTATEQAKLGTNLPQYSLKYSATDGDGAAPAAIAPFGTAGTGPGQIQDARGIATDSSGNVYVIDRVNQRVMKYDSNGSFLMQFGSAGSGDGQFSDPRGIAVSPNGTIWVTDEGVGMPGEAGAVQPSVQAFNSSGQFIRKITYQTFADPYGVATGPGGVLWVSDVTSHQLYEFNENGTLIRTAGGDGGSAEMTTPSGLATDAAGNVWLSDWSANRVQKYNSNGHFVMQFSAMPGNPTGQLETPIAVAVAPSGNLLVTEEKNNRVDVFQPNGRYLRQFGSVGSGNAGLSAPKAIAVGPGNNAYISDFGNHRVARWSHADLDNQSGVVSTEVKVDGQLVEPKYAPGCPTENCAINNREWPLESSNYAAGQHTLEVIATDGVGLQTSKSLTFEVHPAPPSLALLGSMTEQAALGNTRPRYTLQAEAGPNGQSGETLTPTFLSAFGTAGSGTGQLNGPRGVASDGKGHVWIVDRANNRVEQFNEAGEYLSQFGSAGSGNGQFNNPWGIAVTPAGNLWVADTENQRVEEFNSKGEFLQKFGTKAGGSSKGTEFVLPEGIAVAPGGMIWVTDYNGNRIAEFRETVSSESERLVRNATGATIELPRGVAVDGSGDVWVANVGSNQLLEFSPEGSFIRSVGSSGSGNGQLSNPGGLSIDSSGRIYLVDQNNSRVQVFSAKGEFLQKFGTAGSGNGNFSEPKAIALGAGGAIFVTDKGNNRVHKWLQALPADPVASIEVKVDGKAVSTTPIGCASSNCTLAKEWILKSAEYLGSHSVVVKATTASGWSTTKTLTVEAHPDATAPALESGGALIEAPEGWVEQKAYGFTATAKDTGYGVTSLAFKIDGQQVASTNQACLDGGCPETLAKSVDMSPYSGGAHAAELIATDGAGKVAKKNWTINVDPKGSISTAEAKETLIAMEATSGVRIVGPPTQVESGGSESSLELESAPSEIVVSGSLAPTAISSDGEGIVTMESPTPESPALPEGEVQTNQYPQNGESVESLEERLGGAEIKEVTPEYAPVEVAPTTVGEGATTTQIAGTSAAVTANTTTSADTVTRPLYDGAMQFEAIRAATVPATYSWELPLRNGQTLKLLDSQHAEVYFSDETPALEISAELAHDATGKEVPTGLNISEGNVVTLTVHHQQGDAEGHPYVYPIVAGAGFQVGYEYVIAIFPPPPTSGGGEEEEIGITENFEISAPEPATAAEAEISNLPNYLKYEGKIKHRHFRWFDCEYRFDPPDVHLIDFSEHCGNPFKKTSGDSWNIVNWGMRGDYYIVPGAWIKHRGGSEDHIECDKMLIKQEEGVSHYQMPPPNVCKWWGASADGGGSFQEQGKHITPYGSWVWAERANEGPWFWYHQNMAIYLWASGHVGKHSTDCIDC
jgi:streptogramin lyase